MDMHGTFNTPFDSPGWGEMPYLIGFAGGDDVDNWDPRWVPNAFINRDEEGHPLYVTLRIDTPYCDLHNLQPDLVEPYDTWDEGWNELYTEPCKKVSALRERQIPTPLTSPRLSGVPQSPKNIRTTASSNKRSPAYGRMCDQNGDQYQQGICGKPVFH